MPEKPESNPEPDQKKEQEVDLSPELEDITKDEEEVFEINSEDLNSEIEKLKKLAEEGKDKKAG